MNVFASSQELISVHTKTPETHIAHARAMDINRKQMTYSAVGCLVAGHSNISFPPDHVGSCSVAIKCRR